jgi:type I pantothenate kinase
MKKKDRIFSPYTIFAKEDWAKLRADTKLPLNQNDIENLRGLNEPMSLEEVEKVYLPLSRLLNLYVAATQGLFSATKSFLGNSSYKVPFIIGIGGSVAVGKSTTARILQALLARWSNHPKVSLVNTDGFLMQNSELKKLNLMEKKGFPESYNLSNLLKFLTEIKAGKENVKAPIYSHLIYDIVPDKYINVDRPDILIVEGLNVLQPAPLPNQGEFIPYVSDFFDFSIYVDSEEDNICRWYVDRFLELKNTAFIDKQSYFHKYSSYTDGESKKIAEDIWKNINYKNLRKNILPTRQRADLIIKKSNDHSVEKVILRKI